MNIEKAKVGSVGLIQETEDGRIIQLGMTEEQSTMINVLVAKISEASPLQNLGKDYEMIPNWKLQESSAQLLQQNKELREDLESKWISVKDRLPDSGMPVLIYDDGIGIGFRRDKRFFGLDVYKYEHNVTYWMPLPENPIKTP